MKSIRSQFSYNVLKTFDLFFIFTLGFYLSSCTRSENNDQLSNVTISLPQLQKQTQNKLQGFDESDELQHLIVNISGSQILEPVLYTWDQCEECTTKETVPTSIQLSVKTGDARLIQVLAVFKNSALDKNDIYYGDTTQSLKNESESATVSVQSLFTGLQSITSGQIQGRYLTSLTDGPTGTLHIKFAPPNKPAMTLFKTSIISGWFSAMILKEMNFTYEVHGTSKFILFENVNLNSAVFNPSNNVIRVSIPNHYKSYGWTVTPPLDSRDAENLIIGFWGSGNSNKSMCFDDNPNSVIAQSMFADQNGTTPMSWAPGEQPDPNKVSILGGIGFFANPTECNNSAQFQTSLGVDSTRTSHNEFRSGQLVGIEFPFQMNSWLDSDSGMTIENITQLLSEDANSKTLKLNLLPGVASNSDHAYLYKFTGDSNFHFKDDVIPCNDIHQGKIPNFSSLGDFAISTNGEIIMGVQLTEVTDATQFAICLAKGSTILNVGLMSHASNFLVQSINSPTPPPNSNFWLDNFWSTVPTEACMPLTLNKSTAFTDEIYLFAYQSAISTGTFYRSQTDCDNHINPIASIQTVPGDWTLDSSDNSIQNFSLYFRTPSTSGSVEFQVYPVGDTTNLEQYIVSNLYNTQNVLNNDIGINCNYLFSEPQKFACLCNSTYTWDLTQNQCIPQSTHSCATTDYWNGSSCTVSEICGVGKIWDPSLISCESSP